MLEPKACEKANRKGSERPPEAGRRKRERRQLPFPAVPGATRRNRRSPKSSGAIGRLRRRRILARRRKDAMAAIALTVLAGFAGGFALRRLGVPAGGLIGSFGAVALLSVASGIAFLPAETRVAVQIVAGAFVGCSIGKDELKTAKAVAKPAAFMLAWYAVFVLAVGFAIWALTPLSLPTALMSCVPGGISDIPIVAASMGANTPDVTLLQLLRLLLGIALMAAVAQMVTRKTRRTVRGAAKIDPRAPGALATPPSVPTERPRSRDRPGSFSHRHARPVPLRKNEAKARP